MGLRGKPHRSKTPLLVSASALTRAIDPKTPSRITVLRLLGDALHTFEESQLLYDAIKVRAAAYVSRNPVTVATRVQLDADSRARAAHEAGARALFSAVVAALIRLPSVGGALKRRAAQLLAKAGKTAGPAVVMQAAEAVRSHISGLKRLTWSDAERGDFEVVSAIMHLADVSAYAIAGREVAKDSLVYLLGQRVRQKCRRGDLTLAVAAIVQSFPSHAPPDDRLLDQLLELALSPGSVKQGSAGAGSAILAGIAVPYLVSRGPHPADEVVANCAKAMRSAATASERAMWVIAMVRASVTARRSTTYQLRKYGNSQTGTKFPRGSNSFNRLVQIQDRDLEEGTASVWVSNETFELALVQVAKGAGLDEGRMDGSMAVASLVRMWGEALPENISEIVPRACAKLLPELSSVAAVSAMVDGLWLGLLKDLKPSLSPTVFQSLLPALSAQSDLSLSATLHLCGTLLHRFGRQCISESGLTTSFGAVTTTVIAKIHEALDVSSQVVRISSVRLMSALIAALPRTCSQFLTAVLQNLRIADLAMVTKSSHSGENRSFSSLRAIEKELSSVLGNAAALSVLIRMVSSKQYSVPAALLRQCKVDSLALLRPHHATRSEGMHGKILGHIRRRAGWGLVAALARAQEVSIFESESLPELILLWKAELGFAGKSSSKNGVVNSYSNKGSHGASPAVSNELVGFHSDDLLAASSTRSAALYAMFCSLQHASSVSLTQSATALVGACAARIISTQVAHGMPTALGTMSWATDGAPHSNLSPEGGRSILKLSRFLTVESVQLIHCVSMVPPRGDVAELCYFIALSVCEEAQKVTGETGIGVEADSTVTSSLIPNSDVGWLQESAMSNHKPSLLKSTFYTSSELNIKLHERGKTDGMHSTALRAVGFTDIERSWIFGMRGFGTLLAENVLTSAAVAIAALASEDLSSSGSLLVSLSSAKLSPSVSAIITLEMSRRLSHSDLAEINRALAVLQVLARKSLGVTGGLQKAILSESKAGRLYTPHIRGDGSRFYVEDVPGAVLGRVSRKLGWVHWARRFSDEGLLTTVPFHDFHTRALGMMYATRVVASDAHRELGNTGGPTLWLGLIRNVLASTKDNLSILSPSQAILACNCLAALGALLEAIPDKLSIARSEARGSGISAQSTFSSEIDDVVDEAMNILIIAIQSGNYDVQAIAALSISNCSNQIASASERLIGILHSAWAFDTGKLTATGLAGRCAHDGIVWDWCFARIWRDMGIKIPNESRRFYEPGSSASAGISLPFAIGTGAVLSSCRTHWSAVTESSFSSVMEMSIELIQWPNLSAQRAKTAGLHGIIALWGCKTEGHKEQYHLEGRTNEPVMANGDAVEKHACSSPTLPVEAFSFKEPANVNSVAGPYLDEVLYEALAPIELLRSSDELRAAAMDAISEMLYGAGFEETCASLPRLPETLFASVELGSTRAKSLLNVLARTDSQKRPKYWFGLCRAVCLDGERLNYGSGKTPWDVSYFTKRFAAKIGSEAVEASMSSCRCSVQVEKRLVRYTHDCAYGFLRKIIEFAEDICCNKATDFECCEEGCKLLQKIAIQLCSSSSLDEGGNKVLRDYRDAWDSCVATMERLVLDTVPSNVAKNANEAATNLLISFLRLSHIEYFSSARGKVSALLEASASKNLRRRFRFFDQAELTSVSMVLSFLANVSRVATTLVDPSLSTKYDASCRPRNLQFVRRNLLLLTGDFAYSEHGKGVAKIAEHGGTLISGAVPQLELYNLLLQYVPSVVLGAVATAGSGIEIPQDDVSLDWVSRVAPGTMLIQDEDEGERVALACVVYFFVRILCGKTGKKNVLDNTGANSSHLHQAQEALVSLCCSSSSRSELTDEVLVTFARLDKTAFLQCVHRLSVVDDVPSSVRILVTNITLSIITYNLYDIGNSTGNKIPAVCDALRTLTNTITWFHRDQTSTAEQISSSALDVLFHLTGQGNREDLYWDETFQEQTANCLKICVQCLRGSPKLVERSRREINNILREGLDEQNEGCIRLGLMMYAAFAEVMGNYDPTILLYLEKEFQPHGMDHRHGLSFALETPAGEKIIARTLCELSTKAEDTHLKSARALVYRLGLVGLSNTLCRLSVAIRSSITIIQTDGDAAAVINQAGLVLYSIFMSKLIQSLPRTKKEMTTINSGYSEEANFVRDLVGSDPTSLRLLVSTLGAGGKHRVKLLLQAYEVSGQVIEHRD